MKWKWYICKATEISDGLCGLKHLSGLKCSVMIQRSWFWTVRSKFQVRSSVIVGLNPFFLKLLSVCETKVNVETCYHTSTQRTQPSGKSKQLQDSSPSPVCVCAHGGYGWQLTFTWFLDRQNKLQVHLYKQLNRENLQCILMSEEWFRFENVYPMNHSIVLF